MEARERVDRQLAGVIFDMNGTMVDDASYQRAAWQVVCSRRGRALSDGEYRDHVAGRKEADVLAHLFGADLSKEEGAAVAEEKRRLYRESFDPVQAEVPGLRDLLQALGQRGVPLALATSASRSTIDFLLDALQVRELFQQIVQANEVVHGKPEPDIYLQAAAAIGVLPSRCVVFEDSIAGVKSAKTAGMACVGITTTLSANELVAGGADHVVPDFRALSVDGILSLVHASG